MERLALFSLDRIELRGDTIGTYKIMNCTDMVN